MHRKKRQMKSDEKEPKVQSAEALVHHPPGHFGKPEIERADQGKDRATDQHVMKMRNDEKRVMYLKVHRHGSLHHSCEPAENERKDKPCDKQQRRSDDEPSGPERGNPAKYLYAARDRDHHARSSKETLA